MGTSQRSTRSLMASTGHHEVAAQLARQGVSVDEKTVAASLRRQGLEGIGPRRFRPVTTLPGVATHHIPDLVLAAMENCP